MGFIYKITNIKNGHSYVGQTRRTVEQRWKEHQYYYEGCIKLQRAIKKYGIESFKVETLEQCDDSELDDREKYWISYYDTFNNGYNLTLGGQQGGYKYNYEAIVEDYLKTKNVQQTAKNIGCSYHTVDMALEIYSIDKESWEKSIEMIDPKTKKVLKTFSTMTEAAEYLNGQVGTISGAVSGYRDSAYGYYWRKVGEEKEFPDSIPRNYTNQLIIQLDKDSEEELNRFNSIAEANRFLNKKENNGGIKNVLSGRAKTAHGYKWKRIFKV